LALRMARHRERDRGTGTGQRVVVADLLEGSLGRYHCFSEAPGPKLRARQDLSSFPPESGVIVPHFASPDGFGDVADRFFVSPELQERPSEESESTDTVQPELGSQTKPFVRRLA